MVFPPAGRDTDPGQGGGDGGEGEGEGAAAPHDGRGWASLSHCTVPLMLRGYVQLQEGAESRHPIFTFSARLEWTCFDIFSIIDATWSGRVCPPYCGTPAHPRPCLDLLRHLGNFLYRHQVTESRHPSTVVTWVTPLNTGHIWSHLILVISGQFDGHTLQIYCHFVTMVTRGHSSCLLVSGAGPGSELMLTSAIVQHAEESCIESSNLWSRCPSVFSRVTGHVMTPSTAVT